MAAAPDTVLLVDDEPPILTVLSLGFKKAAVPTRSAASAEEALALLDTDTFAAVVADKNLPGKSGLELLRVVAERQPDCARIVITGYANMDSVLEALKLGVDDYLLKPFESIALVVARVRQAVAHRRVLAERRALSAALHVLEESLRSSEAEAFDKGTELELLQSVLALKLEDATRSLSARVSALEAERAALGRTLRGLADEADGPLRARLLDEARRLG